MASDPLPTALDVVNAVHPPDVTPKTESGRAYLAKLGPETGIGSHNIRRDAILAIEQEAASKAVAEVLEWLEEAGFEPDSNVCNACGHHGGDHDLGNWCLLCPRPDMPARPFDDRLAAGWCYFASMDKAEQWAHGIASVRALIASERKP